MHADTVVGEIVSLTIGSTVVGLMYGDQWRLADCDVYLDGLSERLSLAVARAVGSRCRAPGPGARTRRPACRLPSRSRGRTI